MEPVAVYVPLVLIAFAAFLLFVRRRPSRRVDEVESGEAQRMDYEH